MNSKLNRRVSPTKSIDDLSYCSSSQISTNTTAQNPRSFIINKFVVIWLDANLNDGDDAYQNSISRLQRIATAIHTFTNINDCLEFLDTSKNEKILMVISNDFLQEIWPRVRSMSQIHSVYIISPDGEKKLLSIEESDKVKGIFNKVEPLFGSVKRDNSEYQQDALVMSIIPSGKYTKKDLKKLNQLFIYWMVVKLIILNIKPEKDDHKQALKIFAGFCRTQYFNNDAELKIIDEFERDYYKHLPTWWYTRNCFLSVMLSRAFQTQDTEIIIKIAFYIRDLFQQLQKVQIDSRKTSRYPITAYRSQNVMTEDLEKLKDIKGNLLSFNNFLLGDTNYESSLDLARRAQSNNNGIGILFRMTIESRHTSTPFASLQNISYSSDQGKFILFSMHSIFRITDMKQIEDRLWEIHLTLAANNDEQVICLTELLRQETKGIVGWSKLAEVSCIIRNLDQAKEVYYTLLELIPENDMLKAARIYNELGLIHDEMGEYAAALVFYQKAIEIRQQHLPPNHRSLSISYNNIGEVQRQLGDYFNSLSTHQKTLHIKKKILQPDDLSLATTYNNIALANESLAEFGTALDFHQKALNIKQKVLPADHQDLATSYNNIGELHRSMGNYSDALACLEKALSIRLKKYPPTDTVLGIPYNNIGLIYRELGDYPTALSYLQKSLDVKLKTFPSHHPSLTFTYNNIGDVSQQMGEYSTALLSYQKALEIQEKVFPDSHPEIATTYINIGAAHQSMGNYSVALGFYQKAVKIRQKSLPADHPSLGTCYNNIGHVHQLMGEYTIALEHYQKTLKLQEKSLRVNHPSLAATYNNIADVHRKSGNYTKALMLYKKSLDIKKKSLPPNHPTLITSYNNIGVIHQVTKDYPAALECYKQTLEIQQKTLPPNHPDLATVYNNIGVATQSMKEYSKALEYYKKALEIQEKGLPATHPNIATAHNSLATAYANLGNFQSAIEHEQRAVDIASQTLGPDHPNLITFRNYLERLHTRVQST